MIRSIYGRVWSVLKNKPVKLWGLSLLFAVLSGLTVILGVVPLLTIALALLLEQGMRQVYLRGYRGEEAETEQVFSAFRTGWQRRLGSMAWAELIAFLWGLIPIVGVIFSGIRSYENRFVPYIIESRPELSFTEVRKLSKEQTSGWKGMMFLADLIPLVICAALALLLSLFGLIPLIGLLFRLALVVLMLACAVFLPLLLGLINAACYEEITSGRLEKRAERARNPQLKAAARNTIPEGAAFCPFCGAALDPAARFCPSCGAKREEVPEAASEAEPEG